MAVRRGDAVTSDPREALAGRIFDLVAASILLVVTAPMLAVGAAMVLVVDGRPVFFGHRRMGRGRREFRCWKLRTMEVDAEAALERDEDLRRQHRQNGFKLSASGDPRVTRTGRWLRRTYLDELPQLVNVLLGDMSLLGPRPIVEKELENFGPDGLDLLLRRPGIFGAWNSMGRLRPPYPERADLELRYVRERSLKWDLLILRRSVTAVLEGEAEE